ncbi:hypothetical protein BOTBODRAFT_176096 [Botryobasidium botryosum FD-172 SS1]|uniref:Fungal-type protein kinase domain-containing protein n=1 Tax=Botryobasidium botryosum (strain FD-172 SS1) TaxID=930990 RepID=A0A067MM64_BOTB1|nr:hypothetical protein BOTBODRAFT_176096 [Botryobasidium botryosum FD-172 SS1]
MAANHPTLAAKRRTAAIKPRKAYSYIRFEGPVANRLTRELNGGRLFSPDLIDHIFGALVSVDEAKEVLSYFLAEGIVTAISDSEPSWPRDLALENAVHAAVAVGYIRDGDVLSQSPTIGPYIWGWAGYPSDRPPKETDLVNCLNAITTRALEHLRLYSSKELTIRWKWACAFDTSAASPPPEPSSENADLFISDEESSENAEPGPANADSTRSYGAPDVPETTVPQVDQRYNNWTNAGSVGELGANYWQLFRYIRGLRRAQPWRRFCLGLSVAGKSICLCRTDQSGTEEADFDITTSRPTGKLKGKEWEILIGFAIMDDEQLGVDPRIKLTEGVTETAGASSVMRKPSEITFNGGSYEIEDVLFNAKSIPGRGTRVYAIRGAKAIKLSWTPLHRQTGLPEYDEMPMHELAKEKGVINVVFVSNISDTRRTTMDGIRQFGLSALNPQLKTQDRLRRAMIMERKRPLRDFESLEEPVAGIVDTVKGHESLYTKAEILHRDVSEGNIVLGMPFDAPRGFLIDLEMAVDTPPYMAVDVLEGVGAQNPHSVQHDLESFFYPRVIRRLCEGTFGSMAAHKTVLMSSSEEALHALFTQGPKYWRQSKTRLRDVIQLVHSTHHIIFKSTSVPTHADFRRPLEAWLNGDREPDSTAEHERLGDEAGLDGIQNGAEIEPSARTESKSDSCSD